MYVGSSEWTLKLICTVFSLYDLLLSNIISIFRLLAHLYAAEALVLLDKISEALEHLSPENIKDLSFDIPLDQKSSNEEQLLKTNPPISKCTQENK